MNRSLFIRSSPVLAVLCMLLLTACIGKGPDTTLHTLKAEPQQPLGREFAGFKEMIVVLPVRLAPQLQGRRLISQQSATEARASTNHLWAGPLDQQVGDTLVSHLRNLLATANVALFPGPRYGATRYQVEIELSEFRATNQTFTTAAVYTLSDPAANTMLSRATFQQTRPVDRPDYSASVAAASLAIADLSREVAVALQAARRAQPQPLSRP